MKVSYKKMQIVESAINKAAQGKHATVYQLNSILDDGPATFGVSWGSIGTTDVRETLEFAENLKKFASLAEILNELDIEYDWDAEYEVSKEARKKAIESLATMIDIGYVECVKLFIKGE